MAMMRLILPLLVVVGVYSQWCCDGLNTDGVLLLSFKYSILSDPNHVLDTWDFLDQTPCSWRGVLCSDPDSPESSRVIGLSLPGSQLLGSLPSNLGQLNCLETLNLSSNSINGSIPGSLFTLPELRQLDLSGNLISGEIPDLLGGLRSLEVLNLSENALAGNIPRSLSGLENLTAVNLRGNYFSGNIPGELNHVRVLDLSSNLLNGSLPVDIAGVSVEYLNISYNRISGDIPPDFAQSMPENATLDFSYNNFTGEIPDSNVFLNQEKSSFVGNSDLCGPPSGNPCPIPSSPTSPPATSDDQPISPPAFAAIPRSFFSPKGAPAGPADKNPPKPNNNSLRPYTIAAIVVGDLAGIAVLGVIFFYVYRRKTGGTKSKKPTTPARTELPLSTSSSSSSETKGIAKWSCLRKGKSDDDEEQEISGDDNDEDDDDEAEKQSQQQQQQQQQQGQLVTVDGERELELETLLKASAYILGSSGATIMYKAVLEDGAVLAVRRVGDCSGAEKFRDFEGHVRAIAKLTHPNLVRVRGFYWSSDEKLVIYEYVPNGSLANARHRKATGSSPRHIPWEVRLKIAKGIARGLNYIHEKKHVHGNLKPSNVLLGLDMEPKIGDFGLERLTMGKSAFIPGGSTRHFGSKRSTASRDSFQDHSLGATPSPSASSIGCVSPYYPPESLRSLKPSPKWDVYSFGVILLELLTGKVVVSDELGPPVLAGLAVGLEDKTRVLRMADPAIRTDLEGKEEALFACLKLGYNCVSHVAQKRPSMKEALQVLEKIPTCSNPSSSHCYGP